jgi:hypothetical protein
MLAPKKANPKKQYILIGVIVIAAIAIGWLLWWQFLSGPDTSDVGVVPADDIAGGAAATPVITADEVDLSFLRSSQFRELRGEPIVVATSTVRTANPFSKP